ncbi:MAG: DUF120 domain-containing protein [Thermofilaceae archaeon]
MKRYELLALLLELAKQGCARAPVAIDKVLVASNLEISAWTLNKWIRDAAQLGYVELVASGRGKRCLLTEKAISELSSLLVSLEFGLKGVKRLVLAGTVFKGLGEGAFYTSLTDYRDHFRTFLGFDPYPGTLNVRLDPESVAKRKILDSYEGYRIPPIVRGEVEYCGARLFRAVINGRLEGGVVIPDKTVYGPDVLEVLAKVCVKEALGIKDGDRVSIEILLG